MARRKRTTGRKNSVSAAGTLLTIFLLALCAVAGAGAWLVFMAFGPAKGTIADLDPGAKSLEGYLFPDTYRFSPKENSAQIPATMVRRFRQAAAQIGLRENVHGVVTMASLVERETAVDGERALVAGVFENRLAKDMPLM